MRLIVDCFKQVKGVGKSIGIYNVALNLVRNLSTLDNKNLELIVLGNKFNREDFSVPGVQFVEIDKDPRNKLYCIFWELFDVVKFYKQYKADVILFPRGFTSFFRNMNDVIIVHDLIPFYYNSHYPGYFNRLENAYIMNRLKASIRGCKKVITISEASKQDIVRITGINPDKISVIYNGRNKIDVKPMNKDGYIVAMTSGLPHKNAAGVVKSYEEYCSISDNPLPLKIIGIDDASCYLINQELLNNIECFKFIKSNDEMHGLIGEASAFLFLSEIEGFGLPVIEAMELGVPVICSDCSSLPEVVGDAAVLVDPHNYEAAGKAISELLSDKERQDNLVALGFENIRRFGWDIITGEYMEVLTNMI